jgi:hypothetical protein
MVLSDVKVLAWDREIRVTVLRGVGLLMRKLQLHTPSYETFAS